MLRTATISIALLVIVSANSPYARQTSNSNIEGSGLDFINFQGSTANPIVGRDQEGSGLMMDEEGSGSELLADDSTNNVFQQVINITNSDVETLVIKVHLPQRNTTQLIDELKDDSAQQSNPVNSLSTALSLTSVLNDLLERIQDASTTQN